MAQLTYTPVPERVRGLPLLADPERAELLRERMARFAAVPAPAGNSDGEVERLGEVEVVHRFVDAPGDSETVRWHFVEAGEGEPVVFLHGLPESWWQWHHQLEALAPTHRVVAVDLKGYGQSDKRTGDYRQEGVAEQLVALLDAIGIDELNLVAHDRGTVVADYLAANHAGRVLRYVRGEQHLWHFHPDCAPQEALFTSADAATLLGNRLVPVAAYTNLTHHEIPDDDVARAVQEWSFEGIGLAVPRYFNSSSFRKEWIDRRTRLIERWTFPVLVLQGYHDRMQPREFYEGVEQHLPDARVAYVDAGHFYVLENPEQTTKEIREFLTA